VVNEVTDINQLAPLAREAKENIGVERIEVVADKGYYNAHVERCIEAGITPYTEKGTGNAGRAWERKIFHGNFYGTKELKIQKAARQNFNSTHSSPSKNSKRLHTDSRMVSTPTNFELEQ
jgi:hypothetical protein